MDTIKKNKILVIFITVVALALLISNELKTDSFLEISFLDVGQGDSIYVEAFGKIDMLIDGGKNTEVLLRELSSTMDRFDNSIDVLVITHPDEDHSGALVSVVEEYNIGSIFISGNIADNTNYNQILEIAKTKNIPTFKAVRGTNIYLDNKKKIKFEILSPEGNVSFIESNNASISGRLIYGKSEFMLTGDAYIDVEENLINQNKDIKSDILKLGHHGSKTSTSLEFLKAVNPEVVIISAGKNNSYGHPHQSVMDRVKLLGIKSLATYDLGTITFISDGEKIYLKN